MSVKRAETNCQLFRFGTDCFEIKKDFLGANLKNTSKSLWLLEKFGISTEIS